MNDIILEHLESMCDGPCDLAIQSVERIEPGAYFVRFTFDGEDQVAVYYPSDDLLFTPSDWQREHPATPDEIEDCTWINSAGDEAIVLNGLPRVFTSYRDDFRKSFGAKVKRLREEKGFSQVELANRAGLFKQNVHRIESGRYSVTLDTIARLSAVLGPLT